MAGTLDKVVELVVQTVAYHILVGSAVLQVQQFQRHVLVASVGTLLGQADFQILHIGGDGHYHEVAPHLCLLVKFQCALWHIDYQPILYTIEHTIAQLWGHKGVTCDVCQRTALVEGIVAYICNGRRQQHMCQHGPILKAPRGYVGNTRCAAHVEYGTVGIVPYHAEVVFINLTRCYNLGNILLIFPSANHLVYGAVERTGMEVVHYDCTCGTVPTVLAGVGRTFGMVVQFEYGIEGGIPVGHGKWQIVILCQHIGTIILPMQESVVAVDAESQIHLRTFLPSLVFRMIEGACTLGLGLQSEFVLGALCTGVARIVGTIACYQFQHHILLGHGVVETFL